MSADDDDLPFGAAEAPGCADTVRILEDLLVRARAGEFSGAMVIAEMSRTDSAVVVNTTAYGDAQKRLGAIEVIRAQIFYNLFHD